MQSFTFHCPTEIVFGRGAENAVAEKLRALGVKTTKRLQRDLTETTQESALQDTLQDKGLPEGEED
mgnify:CR=1 FL=1